MTGTLGYFGKRAVSLRERSHNENTLPFPLCTRCWYRHSSHRPNATGACDPATADAGTFERTPGYSTVTLFARLRGWSTSVPRMSATW